MAYSHVTRKGGEEEYQGGQEEYQGVWSPEGGSSKAQI